MDGEKEEKLKYNLVLNDLVAKLVRRVTATHLIQVQVLARSLVDKNKFNKYNQNVINQKIEIIISGETGIGSIISYIENVYKELKIVGEDKIKITIQKINEKIKA